MPTYQPVGQMLKTPPRGTVVSVVVFYLCRLANSTTIIDSIDIRLVRDQVAKEKIELYMYAMLLFYWEILEITSIIYGGGTIPSGAKV